MVNLVDSWRRLRICDFCETQSGGTPSRQNSSYYTNGTIPWIKSGELKQALITSSEEYITPQAINESSAKLIPPGGLLLAMYGATVGQCSILGVPAATNQAICSIVPDNEVCIPKFLYYAIKSRINELLIQRVGGAQPNISQGIIRKLEILLPPIAEQHKIVQILDSASNLCQMRTKATQLYTRTLQSLFRKRFGEISQNSFNFPICRLDQVIESTKNGIYKHESFYGRGTRVLKMYNILDSWWNLNRVDLVELTEDEARDYHLAVGDILLNRVNTPELVGKCAVINAELEGCVFESKNIRIRVDSKKVTPEYVSFYLNSLYGHSVLVRGMKHAIGMATVNNTDLRQTEMPIPPLEIQVEWSKDVKRVRSIIGKGEASALQLESLFQVLLQRAFDGRLTAGWRVRHAEELMQEMYTQSKSLAAAN